MFALPLIYVALFSYFPARCMCSIDVIACVRGGSQTLTVPVTVLWRLILTETRKKIANVRVKTKVCLHSRSCSELM